MAQQEPINFCHIVEPLCSALFIEKSIDTVLQSILNDPATFAFVLPLCTL